MAATRPDSWNAVLTITFLLAFPVTVLGGRGDLEDTQTRNSSAPEDVLVDFNNGYSRIVGGLIVQEIRYPYLANVGKGNVIFCGGSLIAKRVVMTAAHCKEADAVWLGNLNLMNPTGEKIPVIDVVNHPNYMDRTSSSDIRLLYLERDAVAGPVKLITPEEWFNIKDSAPDLTVMGWGGTGQGKSMTHILREVDVRLWDYNVCKGRYPAQLDDTMICAASAGKDACQGDSGGPLVMRGYAYDGSQDYQVGIVSWGYGCAQQYFPGVYTNVHNFLGWIQEQLKRWGQSFDLGRSPAPTPFSVSVQVPTSAEKPVKLPINDQVSKPSKVAKPVGLKHMDCQEVDSAYAGGGIRIQCTNRCERVELRHGQDGMANAFCYVSVL